MDGAVEVDPKQSSSSYVIQKNQKKVQQHVYLGVHLSILRMINDASDPGLRKMWRQVTVCFSIPCHKWVPNLFHRDGHETQIGHPTKMYWSLDSPYPADEFNDGRLTGTL